MPNETELTEVAKLCFRKSRQCADAKASRELWDRGIELLALAASIRVHQSGQPAGRQA